MIFFEKESKKKSPTEYAGVRYSSAYSLIVKSLSLYLRCKGTLIFNTDQII